MIRPYSPIRMLVLVGLLLTATQLAMAQSRAILPVKLQIPDEGEVQRSEDRRVGKEWRSPWSPDH